MIAQINIENCQECPYSWAHTGHTDRKTWVCDKLQDNVGVGDTIHKECPWIKEGKQDG